MRIAADTGGTFTDLVVEVDGSQHLFKALTTPEDPSIGVVDALQCAASKFSLSLEMLLGRCTTFVHATTHSINAMLTGRTASTGFITTEGHPDILLFREGGRFGMNPFDLDIAYPKAYVPRSLTFELPGRISASGQVVRPFDEEAARKVIQAVAASGVEAVGVCLLWSIVNPEHEDRMGEMLRQALPDVQVTLSHQINAIGREYRRASSAVIDASLKPLMSRYLGQLGGRLRSVGYDGKLLVVTSIGSVLSAEEVAAKPILTINSGPSMAPVAGRVFGREEGFDTVIIMDSGGTTCDVSVVDRGMIGTTTETWIGTPFLGHMTGFPSTAVHSIGAGGGSIAWVDRGGLLKVGPQSAGADPGPACYGRGTLPTVTDAALVLGYIDPDAFLGGAMTLDRQRAVDAIQEHVASSLGMDVDHVAESIVELATEQMVVAIEDMTIKRGIDPADAILIGAGGAAGLNLFRIARRLGCRRAMVPSTAALFCASGALLSELATEYSAALYITSEDEDVAALEPCLDWLMAEAKRFIDRSDEATIDSKIQLFAEARYAGQNWSIVIPIDRSSNIVELVEVFHAEHERTYGFRDVDTAVEFMTWRARAGYRTFPEEAPSVSAGAGAAGKPTRRSYLSGVWAEVPLHAAADLNVGEALAGPAIVESPFTTIVIEAGVTFWRSENGSLIGELAYV